MGRHYLPMGKIKVVLKILLFPIIFVYKVFKFLYQSIEKYFLKKYISKIDISSIDSLSGYEFEDFLTELFKCIGFKVIETQKSKDYGADLIIKTKNISIAIQCKLYFNHKVSNSAIQEIASARKYYNTDVAVVITNLYFSKPASILAEKNNVILWDREMILKLLRTINTNSNKSVRKYILSTIPTIITTI